MAGRIARLSCRLDGGEVGSFVNAPVHDNADCADLVLTSDEWCALLERRRRVGWPLHFAGGAHGRCRSLEKDRDHLTSAALNAESAECSEAQFLVKNHLLRHGAHGDAGRVLIHTMKNSRYQGAA